MLHQSCHLSLLIQILVFLTTASKFCIFLLLKPILDPKFVVANFCLWLANNNNVYNFETVSTLLLNWELISHYYLNLQAHALLVCPVLPRDRRVAPPFFVSWTQWLWHLWIPTKWLSNTLAVTRLLWMSSSSSSFLFFCKQCEHLALVALLGLI